MTSLDILLRPRSIAMIGASGDVTRIGGRAMRHLKEVGFSGDIFPVNPGRDEVQGVKAYASVDDIPGRVECAVLALPTGAVLPAIEACARKGVGAAVIFSAGFAEMGDEGVALQQRMVDIARGAGMRLLGPNCLGMYNLHANSFLSFSGIFDDVKGTLGRLGLVSQSGGYAGEVVKSAQEVGLDFGVWITTGNEADIGLGEAMQYMAMSDDVDVVVGYIEGVRDRQAFFDGLAAAHARRKPVVVLKVGRTEQGAKAAASHTASLAGSDGVYDAVFERYGVYRARTTEEMLDVAYAASRGRFPTGRRLAILTNSGGIGVQAADFAADEALEVPSASDGVQAKLMEISPNGAPFNPIDLTGQVANDPPMYARAIDVVLASGEFDTAYINVGLIAGLPFIKRPLVDSLKTIAERYADVPLAASVTAPAETLAEYVEAGYLCYREPARAIKALSALATFPEAWNKPLPGTGDLAGLPTIATGTEFSEAASKALLAEIGVPSPAEHLVQDPAAAEAAATSIGRKVAIKVVSPDILHKTEIGGVALNVAPEDAAATLETMIGKVTAAMPDARIEGYLISPMITGGTECIVGVHTDPLLGPVIMFGLGGVTVELMKDVTTRLAPVSEDEAMEMIRSVRSYPLLDGFRGRAKADVAALAKAISALSRLAAANADTVRTIEVNPLLVLDEGEGVMALDAVIEA
ncbi:acetate--CoA ligase family protein [uncultured Novosphingobium sp.]|uniref:acetate--CoA ligase family protein n=1 Tax=uncultured Novosphingobium sp. TaxID=292277 RepID=UPI00374845DF